MPEVSPGVWVTQGGWDDIPHLTEKAKADLLRATPPYLRGARMRGEPTLGKGRIYPVDIDAISVDPMQIPRHWPRAYGMDFGWHRTAAIWGAWDEDADCIYLYSEYYRGEASTLVHSEAVKKHGAKLTGLADPAAEQMSQKDGEKLIEVYRRHGLNLEKADNRVASGIQECFERMTTNRLKVFRTLQNFRYEFGIYIRDEKGKIVKHNDHLMDAMRYLVVDGYKHARTGLRDSWAQEQSSWGVADSRAGY